MVLIMTFGVMFLGTILPVEAKTASSARADNIFFYATNSQGKDVLLKVMSLSEVEAISHGKADGSNYYFSCTDNLPTTVYTEAKGVTVPELVNYVKNNSTVAGAANISYAGSDRMCFMATDSNGVYNKDWTYDQLYSNPQYYFPDLFSSWNVNWEISDDKYGPTDSQPMSMDTYNTVYKNNDKYYNDKRKVFDNGQKTDTILAVQHQMSRTSTLSSEIAANGGNVTGCLKNELTTDEALRLCIPQSEAVLMSGNRTAYNYYAWIYNMKLNMANAPSIQSLGTVDAPTATVTQNGNNLSIAMNCKTDGAKIYYSLEDGSPQTLYNGEVTYDVSGKDLASNPIKFCMRAVKEGCDDAGIVSVTYPQRAPAFTDIFNATVGNDVSFTADSGVTQEDWNNWKLKLKNVGIQHPGDSTYTALGENQYTINDSTKTITFNKNLFSTCGSYSFQLCADNYANKIMSVTMQNSLPAAQTTDYYMGSDITLSFADKNYPVGTSVSINEKGAAAVSSISSNYLIENIPGKLTINNTYFNSADCAIKAPGKYILTLSNNGYAPSTQTVEINVKSASEKPVGNNFVYTLTTSASSINLDDTITVNVGLTSSVDSYKFYTGEYRIALDNNYFTLGTVSTKGNWQSGTKTANGQTILTFAAMDPTDQGIENGSNTEIGSFTVKPAKAGKTAMLCNEVLLTNADAVALDNVSGNDLNIDVTTGSGIKVPIKAIPDENYDIGCTPDGITYMTVKDNVSGFEYFSVNVSPVVPHSGQEVVLFVHSRAGKELSISATKADFDVTNNAKSGFNVEPGDVVKAYMVDDLTNDLNRNPIILQ